MRQEVYVKFAEAIEKRAGKKMVLKGLNHVFNAVRGGRAPVAAGRLPALNPTLAQALSRTGISLRRALSPKIDLSSLGKYDPRRILSTTKVTPPPGVDIPDYIPQSGETVPAEEILRRLRIGRETTRLSPAKTLAAAGGVGAAGGATAAVLSPDPKQDVAQAQAKSQDLVAQLRESLAQWRREASGKQQA